MIGNFVDAIIRHLGDDNPGASGRFEIDVVHADSKPRDDLALLHLADHVRRDFCISDEHRVRIFRRGHDAFRRGLRREAQLGPGPRDHRAGQVQVRKYGICNCNQ